MGYSNLSYQPLPAFVKIPEWKFGSSGKWWDDKSGTQIWPLGRVKLSPDYQSNGTKDWGLVGIDGNYIPTNVTIQVRWFDSSGATQWHAIKVPQDVVKVFVVSLQALLDGAVNFNTGLAWWSSSSSLNALANFGEFDKYDKPLTALEVRRLLARRVAVRVWIALANKQRLNALLAEPANEVAPSLTKSALQQVAAQFVEQKETLATHFCSAPFDKIEDAYSVFGIPNLGDFKSNDNMSKIDQFGLTLELPFPRTGDYYGNGTQYLIFDTFRYDPDGAINSFASTAYSRTLSFRENIWRVPRKPASPTTDLRFYTGWIWNCNPILGLRACLTQMLRVYFGSQKFGIDGPVDIQTEANLMNAARTRSYHLVRSYAMSLRGIETLVAPLTSVAHETVGGRRWGPSVLGANSGIAGLNSNDCYYLDVPTSAMLTTPQFPAYNALQYASLVHDVARTAGMNATWCPFMSAIRVKQKSAINSGSTPFVNFITGLSTTPAIANAGLQPVQGHTNAFTPGSYAFLVSSGTAGDTKSLDEAIGGSVNILGPRENADGTVAITIQKKGSAPSGGAGQQVGFALSSVVICPDWSTTNQFVQPVSLVSPEQHLWQARGSTPAFANGYFDLPIVDAPISWASVQVSFYNSVASATKKMFEAYYKAYAKWASLPDWLPNKPKKPSPALTLTVSATSVQFQGFSSQFPAWGDCANALFNARGAMSVVFAKSISQLMYVTQNSSIKSDTTKAPMLGQVPPEVLRMMWALLVPSAALLVAARSPGIAAQNPSTARNFSYAQCAFYGRHCKLPVVVPPWLNGWQSALDSMTNVPLKSQLTPWGQLGPMMWTMSSPLISTGSGYSALNWNSGSYIIQQNGVAVTNSAYAFYSGASVLQTALAVEMFWLKKLDSDTVWKLVYEALGAEVDVKPFSF